MSKPLLTVIDFETTGAVPSYRTEAWQIGMVKMGNAMVMAETFNSYLRVDYRRPFNHYVPGRYAEIRDELANSATLEELWSELQPWLRNRVLVAHNIGTEKKILKEAFPLHHLGPWIDTLKLARLAYPGLVSYKLDALIEVCGLKDRVHERCPGLEAHDALYDAVASALFLEKLLAQPDWCDKSIDQLVQLCLPNKKNR